MASKLKKVGASLPRRERTKIKARACALIAEEMSLRDLRKAIGKTQTTTVRRRHPTSANGATKRAISPST
jgi:hypothetical protein